MASHSEFARKVAAGVVVLFLVGSLARTWQRGRLATTPWSRPPAVLQSGSSLTTTDAPAAASEANLTAGQVGALLHFDVQAELGALESGPPLKLQVRARAGATQPFEVNAQANVTRQRFPLEVVLPLQTPELPLRVELLGETWCIPPGRPSLEVTAMGETVRLHLARARSLSLSVKAQESDAPLAGVRLVHESGLELARTDAEGRAHLLRPNRPAAAGGRVASDRLLALGEGRVPAGIDEGSAAPLTLRAADSVSTLRGRVLDANGAGVAGASVLPRFRPVGSRPDDAAARAEFDLLVLSGEHDLSALAVTTDAEGRFQLLAPWPARLELFTRVRELGEASATILSTESFVAANSADVELRFEALFTLRVRVTAQTRPLSGGTIEVYECHSHRPAAPAESRATLLKAAPIARVATTELRVPARASLFVVARAPGCAPAIAPIRLPLHQPWPAVDLALELQRGVAVALQVTGAELLTSDERRLDVLDQVSSVLVASATLGASGRIRLRDLPTGRPLRLEFPARREGPRLLQEGVTLAPADVPAEINPAEIRPGEIDLGEFPLPR